jgi:hypothetical protein
VDSVPPETDKSFLVLFFKKEHFLFPAANTHHGGMDALAEIIRDLLVFIAVMFLLTIALIVTVSRLPDGNPLKRILTALTWRVGATLGAGVVAIPIEPIPGLDALYDVAVPVALLYFWYTFFREAARRPSGRGPIIDHDPR